MINFFYRVLGRFCNSASASGPTGNCSEGYYCTGGSSQKEPTNPEYGGRCAPGQYCPEGASGPIACDAGMFCSLPELPSPEGKCNAGFYCANGSNSREPNGNDGTGKLYCNSCLHTRTNAHTYIHTQTV